MSDRLTDVAIDIACAFLAIVVIVGPIVMFLFLVMGYLL